VQSLTASALGYDSRIDPSSECWLEWVPLQWVYKSKEMLAISVTVWHLDELCFYVAEGRMCSCVEVDMNLGVTV
jgi:hypothetical protein